MSILYSLFSIAILIPIFYTTLRAWSENYSYLSCTSPTWSQSRWVYKDKELFKCKESELFYELHGLLRPCKRYGRCVLLTLNPQLLNSLSPNHQCHFLAGTWENGHKNRTPSYVLQHLTALKCWYWLGCVPRPPSPSTHLDQGSDTKYFRLWESYTITQFCPCSVKAARQYTNEQVWLLSNKTLLRNTEIWTSYNFQESKILWFFWFFSNHFKNSKTILGSWAIWKQAGGEI